MPSAAPPSGRDLGAEETSSSPSSSDATTDFKQMQGLVDRSCFHDEVLCQLLDGIHNRLIGEEAQKALIRAAKARVIELKARQARGEVSSACSSCTGDSVALRRLTCSGHHAEPSSDQHEAAKDQEEERLETCHGAC